MESKNFEYAKGRFINPARIIDVAIYEKQVPGKDNPSDYQTVFRIAYSLDVQNQDKGTVYSDAFPTYDSALAFSKTVPFN